VDKSVISPVLIGRTPFLDSLDRLIQQACQQQGQTVLISAEAGVGKSRLLHELQTRLPLGIARLVGHAFQPERGLPYGPLLDLLRASIDAHAKSPDWFTQHLGSSAPELVKLAPEIATLLPGLEPAAQLDPEQEKRRLFQALAHFFKNVAQGSSALLLIIEDLHWSDETTLDFLLFLARQIASRPILLLLTYRSDELNTPLTRFLSELDREHLSVELALPALSRIQVDKMVGAIFELNRSVRSDFLEPIFALTEGNPFFIEEVLKSLMAVGEIFYADGKWDRKPVRELHIPRSVQDAVGRRMEQLSDAAQATLSLAAVVGRRFDFRLLQGLTTMNEPELVQQIKQMVAAQLIVEESADEFAFRHALTREAVYATLLRRERKSLHQRVAEQLEHLYTNIASPLPSDASRLNAHSAELAYHYHAAEVWDKALDYAQHAGERAQSMYAPREAIAQFTRALEAAQQLAFEGREMAVEQILRRCQLFRMRGQASEVIGDFDSALADYQQCLTFGREAHDAQAEWQALLDLGFLWASRNYVRTGEYFEQALALARTLSDRHTLAHTLNRVGNWYVNIEQPSVGVGYHHEALEIFQALQDRSGLAETYDLLGLASEELGDPLQFTTYFRQAIALFRELDDRIGLASSLASVAVRGENYFSSVCVALPVTPAEIAADAEEALTLARETGYRAGECYALAVLSMCFAPYGEYDRALRAAQDALNVAQAIDHPLWMALAHLTLGDVYLELLAVDVAQTQFEQSLARGQQVRSPIFMHMASAALAASSILQKNLTRAESVLDAALGPLRDRFSQPGQTTGQGQLPTVAERMCLAADVELALTQGDGERALCVVDNLIRTAPHLTPESVIPRLWFLRGEALTRLKRWVEAESVLQAARDTASLRGLRPILWRIHLALGKLYQSQDRRKDADAEYTAARGIIQSLAAELSDSVLRETFLARTDALLPRPRAISTRRVERQQFGGLSGREREIAALIAHGNSNREIAARLVLSERTVITHVSNILNKLGFNSRSQIAVWASEKGLDQPNSA